MKRRRSKVINGEITYVSQAFTAGQAALDLQQLLRNPSMGGAPSRGGAKSIDAIASLALGIDFQESLVGVLIFICLVIVGPFWPH